MRIYFYDEETGIYQGESCEDDRLARQIDGATVVAPPAYARGDIPVYDRGTQTWQLARTRQFLKRSK